MPLVALSIGMTLGESNQLQFEIQANSGVIRHHENENKPTRSLHQRCQHGLCGYCNNAQRQHPFPEPHPMGLGHRLDFFLS